MILGLDISTSITGITVLSEDSSIVYNLAIDTRKYKSIFKKAEVVKDKLGVLIIDPKKIYIEQSLQSTWVSPASQTPFPHLLAKGKTAFAIGLSLS